VQNSLCVQVLRSPILAALPHISSLTEGTVRQHFGHVQLINVWHLLFACDRPTYRRHVRMSLQDRDDERCPADCTVGGRGGGGRYAMQSGRVNWKNCVSSPRPLQCVLQSQSSSADVDVCSAEGINCLAASVLIGHHIFAAVIRVISATHHVLASLNINADFRLGLRLSASHVSRAASLLRMKIYRAPRKKSGNWRE